MTKKQCSVMFWSFIDLPIKVVDVMYTLGEVLTFTPSPVEVHMMSH